MVNDVVKIKSGAGALQLIFAKDATYQEIKENIRDKLASGSGFFLRGTVVLLPPDRLTENENEELRKLFHENGLICRTKSPVEAEALIKKATKEKVPKKTLSQKQNPDEKVQEMLVINKTIRGGQEIRTDSSVLIVGNVNPGAQIIAGGSIDVRGTCQGMVHAGAAGDQSAIIIADHLIPTQIRIANLIARAPDTVEKVDGADRASIKDGQIIIESIER